MSVGVIVIHFILLYRVDIKVLGVLGPTAPPSVTVNLENRTRRVNTRTYKNVVVNQRATYERRVGGLRTHLDLNLTSRNQKYMNRRDNYEPLI